MSSEKKSMDPGEEEVRSCGFWSPPVSEEVLTAAIKAMEGSSQGDVLPPGFRGTLGKIPQIVSGWVRGRF